MTTVPARPSGTRPVALERRLIAGVLGGLAGGVVFGAMMAMMGLLVTLAGMVHSTSPIVGLGIHLMISVVFGLVFVLLAGRFLTSWGRALGAGIVYGIVVWVFGPLLMMPIMLGGTLFAIGPMTLLSLMGHLVYAVILAAVSRLVIRRRA